jgi:L-idonate 5-dehydrogenase
MRVCVIHAAGDLRMEEISDLHYWRHGAVDDCRLSEPLVSGQEAVGTIADAPPTAALLNLRIH